MFRVKPLFKIVPQNLCNGTTPSIIIEKLQQILVENIAPEMLVILDNAICCYGKLIYEKGTYSSVSPADDRLPYLLVYLCNLVIGFNFSKNLNGFFNARFTLCYPRSEKYIVKGILYMGVVAYIVKQ